jgi:RimJ/RimL family protein N-acetyltransferase
LDPPEILVAQPCDRGRGITHLVADVFPDNPTSMRVLGKNGFVRAGTVQKELPQRGGLRDLIRFMK